jgi:hypothetical protein
MIYGAKKCLACECPHGRNVVRSFKLTPLLISLVLLLLPVIGRGQVGLDETARIDATRRTAVVDGLATLLENRYVFPERGKEMAKALHRNLKKKEYDRLTDPNEFAQALTETVREVTNDGHLWVRFEPEIVTRIHEAEADTADSARIEQEDLERHRANNFGFREVKRLSGNIGYLKFDGFSGQAEATEIAEAALTFLRAVDALIFDLRDNGGGSPEMIQYISSYLFKNEEHLNSFYWREDDTVVTTSTYPHIQGRTLTEIPVYVLTSSGTFSAAEEFTYNLKHMGRATIVGDTTGGGAHPVSRFPVDDGFLASVSIGRAINPVTGTNWEGVGIIPHIAVPQDQALDAARLDAMRKIAESGVDEDEATQLRFQIARLETQFNPATLSLAEMQVYVGGYGPRMITLEDGELYYQREERPKYRMIAMGNDRFCFDELEDFGLRFERDGSGLVIAVVGVYDSGYTDRNPKD